MANFNLVPATQQTTTLDVANFPIVFGATSPSYQDVIFTHTPSGATFSLETSLKGTEVGVIPGWRRNSGIIP